MAQQYEYYELGEAQDAVNRHIKHVQAGRMSVEQAIAAVVADTIQAFAEIMHESSCCCGCHWMENANNLRDLAITLNQQFETVKV